MRNYRSYRVAGGAVMPGDGWVALVSSSLPCQEIHVPERIVFSIDVLSSEQMVGTIFYETEGRYRMWR